MRHYLLFICLVLSACAAADQSPDKHPAPTRALIFLPGYYGTALKDANSNERFFITARHFLFGGEAVSLNTDELKTPAAPHLVPDGILTRVPVLFGLFNIDVYGSFIDSLRRHAKTQHSLFVPFAYDWRQDLTDTVRELRKEILALRAQGVARIDIVAHSMGCLVAAYYLAYGDQSPENAVANWSGVSDVQRVVLMAGPYGGAFSLFRNMQTGARIGSNVSYMPAETVASLPASYQLLKLNHFSLLNERGEEVSFPITDVTEWEKRHLGLLHRSDLGPVIRQRRRDFVAAQLSRAKAFSARINLESPEAPANLKVLQLIGKGRLTIDSGQLDSKTSQMTFLTDESPKTIEDRRYFTDGDGSVTLESAQLPAALRGHATTLTTTKPHDKVFEDEAFTEALGKFLE